MPYDWSNPYDSPIAYDVGNPQTAAITGISSTQAFGTTSITFSSVIEQTSGIVSVQAFGSINVLAPTSIALNGIASKESFGLTTVAAPAIRAVSGITSAQSFGITGVSLPFIAPTEMARCL